MWGRHEEETGAASGEGVWNLTLFSLGPLLLRLGGHLVFYSKRPSALVLNAHEQARSATSIWRSTKNTRSVGQPHSPDNSQFLTEENEPEIGVDNDQRIRLVRGCGKSKTRRKEKKIKKKKKNTNNKWKTMPWLVCVVWLF